MSIEVIGSYASIVGILVLVIKYIISISKKLKIEKIEKEKELQNIRNEIKELVLSSTTHTKRNDISVFIQSKLSSYRHWETRRSLKNLIQNIIAFLIFGVSILIIIKLGIENYFSWLLLILTILGLYLTFKMHKLFKEYQEIIDIMSEEFIKSYSKYIDSESTKI